jgi:hypothetical protein
LPPAISSCIVGDDCAPSTTVIVVDQEGVTMRLLFRFIDRLLRKCTGVFEFADNPECLFRLQFGTAPHDIELENEVVRAGEPVLFLHLWNDHIVPVSTQATPVTWAIKAARWLRRSFQQIAQFVLEEPRARDVRAVGGSPGFLSSVDRPAGVLFMRRLGFEIFPYHSPLGRFGLFWENLYSWILIWTYHQHSMRGRHAYNIERFELWMSTEKLLELYGPKSEKT